MGVGCGGVRYKTKGQDRGDEFSKIKFEPGVARTWESVARLYCTSLKQDLQRVRGVGLESFSKDFKDSARRVGKGRTSNPMV